jgi:hypothetical protein
MMALASMVALLLVGMLDVALDVVLEAILDGAGTEDQFSKTASSITSKQYWRLQ